MRHTYYWTCPHCGANLDPGEKCDCQESADEKKLPPGRRPRQQLRTKKHAHTHQHYSL